MIGEIVGGLLLGLSVMGHFARYLHRSLFAAFPTEGQLIWLLYRVGLVLLMFVSGFEVQRSFDRADWRIIAAILIGATVVHSLQESPHLRSTISRCSRAAKETWSRSH